MSVYRARFRGRLERTAMSRLEWRDELSCRREADGRDSLAERWMALTAALALALWAILPGRAWVWVEREEVESI